MTFIQPTQKNFINIAIPVLICILIFASVWLIFLYNRSINLEHGISQTEKDLQKLQVDRAELQDKIFALSNDANLQKLSKERGLFQEKAPQYMEVGGTAAPHDQNGLLAGKIPQ